MEVRMTFIGGLGELYCSQKCYDAGGATITKHLLENWTGDCSVCRKPICLSFGSSASMVCWKPGLFLFHCGSPNCIDEVMTSVRQSDVCAICGAPVSVKKCDFCSKAINEKEMKVAPGSAVVYVTKGGFVPTHVGSGQLAALSAQMGISKAQIWATTVNQNPTADWGFCESCWREFKNYQQDYQQKQARESRQRKETKRREAMPRTEDERRKPIIEQRKRQKVCYFCGRPLGLIYKMLKLTHHLNCNEQNASF